MTSQELQALGFEKAGDVDVVEGKITSTLTPFASEVKSGVYCWVLINESNKKEEVIYIGKYGMSIKKRWGEHRLHNPGSPTGHKNAEYIIQQMAETDIRMELWGKQSHSEEFSYTNIVGKEISKTFSTYSVDEEDLIAHYFEKNGKRPALNRTRGGN
tara:strand:+ start:5994 stop:6464 length:471 start_codon:yes stop_codon:yes gene_type:complete